MKKQIVLVHGGATFDTHEDFMDFLRGMEPSLDNLKKESWKDSLQQKLGENFDVVKLKMPNKMNAKYEEWKLYFEKFANLFNDEVILVGHSLGGIFLAKYLAEHSFPKRVLATFLVAAPFDSDDLNESLGDFILPDDLWRFREQCGRSVIYHSKDDPVVSVTHAQKYKQALPDAELCVLEDRGHLNQPEFSELVEHLDNL